MWRVNCLNGSANQRTLAMGEVSLYNWIGYDQEENLLFVCSESTESKPVKLKTSRMVALPFSLPLKGST